MQILHQLDVACEDLFIEALTFYQRGQVLARDPLEELLDLIHAKRVIFLPQLQALSELLVSIVVLNVLLKLVQLILHKFR